LTTRFDFTESLVNSLEGGATKLTQADLNEESANLLALQTRQQLGINSLALASQSERSILALFG
jgi:flagellin-like hook-associated protein FlgL